MDLDKPTELIPVSQWVYDLYKVTYYNGDPDVAGAREIKTTHIASSSESHLQAEANDRAPRDDCFYTWETVKENVGQPRVVGQMYGMKIHESGSSHGQRLAEKM